MNRIANSGRDPRWPTFSFYLTAHQLKRKPQLVGAIDGVADAVTIAGPAGPEHFERSADSGVGVPVLFDELGYMPNQVRLDPEDWVRRQLRVGSIHPLLPGIYLPWDKDGASDFELRMSVREQGHIASSLGAGMLIALDARWLAKSTDVVIDALASAEAPVALLLAHRGAPSHRGERSRAYIESHHESPACPYCGATTGPLAHWPSALNTPLSV